MFFSLPEFLGFFERGATEIMLKFYQKLQKRYVKTKKILIRIFCDNKKKVDFLLPLYNLDSKHLLNIYHGDKQRKKKEKGRKGRREGSWESEVRRACLSKTFRCSPDSLLLDLLFR